MPMQLPLNLLVVGSIPTRPTNQLNNLRRLSTQPAPHFSTGSLPSRETTRSLGWSPKTRAVTRSATHDIPLCIECAYTRSTRDERAWPIILATLNALSPAVRPRLANECRRLYMSSWQTPARLRRGIHSRSRTLLGFNGLPLPFANT